MNIGILRKPALVVAGVGVVVMGLAGPAAAETVGHATKTADGTWKAYGLYDDANNQICARAFNSVSSARAVVWVSYDGGGQTTNVVDPGGDEERTCQTFAIDGRGSGWINVQHTSSTGQTLFSRARIDSI